MLTRREFEILRRLERDGARAYDLRSLADGLCISGGIVARCLDDLVERGLILRRDGFPCITQAGLEALEPYRVKRAIILGAGFGSRMMPATADRPKPMVTVNGVRIIDTLLDALVGVGITDITLVGGYRFDRFAELREKYPFLTLVENPDYACANNIA